MLLVTERPGKDFGVLGIVTLEDVVEVSHQRTGSADV